MLAAKSVNNQTLHSRSVFMKSILAVAFLIVGLPAVAADAVHGFTRRDGTYVQPYMNSEPNQHRYDNYSSQGNTNPYTGERGTQRNEFSLPPAYNKAYGGTGINSRHDHPSF
jgi:hypothetical protein